MKLRGVDFRYYAFGQSGVTNFDNKGYWYRKVAPNLSFADCSFVAKTVTLLSRRGKAYDEPGNMPLRADGITPMEYMPACIHLDFNCWMRGIALNAVGLSNLGLYWYLQSGIWHKLSEPFQISIAATARTADKRLKEIDQMAWIIQRHLREFPFRAPYGIQLNISCPNTGHTHHEISEVVRETRESLAVLRYLLGNDVPLVVKINALFPIVAAWEICEDENCDGLCNSNTIPWTDIPYADRMQMFGTTISPLVKYEGGGISGKYLFPLVFDWVDHARDAGITKPLIVGGGVLKKTDVDLLSDVGASALAVGSVAFLRSWRTQGIIDWANDIGRRGGFYKH